MSAREGEALLYTERQCHDGAEVAILDIVDVPLVEPRPHACQVENHLVDATRRWNRVGRAYARDLLPFATDDAPLWRDGWSTSAGHNDKIPEQVADALDSSLRLLVPHSAAVRVVSKPTEYGEKTQVRLRFSLGRTTYDVAVTDPRTHSEFSSRAKGEYSLDDPPLICVSLSEPSYGYRYKLAAGVVSLA